MCVVEMDLSKDENLDFAIYNLILEQGKAEFTKDCIVNQLKTYQGIPDECKLENSVKKFINFWLDKGLLRQHWNMYSVI